MPDLTSFLQRAAARPFRYGDQDCLLWLANWVLESTGKDIAEGIRGSYDTALGAMRHVERAGGAQKLMERQIRRTFGRVRRVVDLKAGDIGLAIVEGKTVGAIFAGSNWAVLGESTLKFGRPKVFVAWRVG